MKSFVWTETRMDVYWCRLDNSNSQKRNMNFYLRFRVRKKHRKKYSSLDIAYKWPVYRKCYKKVCFDAKKIHGTMRRFDDLVSTVCYINEFWKPKYWLQLCDDLIRLLLSRFGRNSILNNENNMSFITVQV